MLLVYCLCTVVTESLEKKVKQGSEVFTGVFFLDIKLNIKKIKTIMFPLSLSLKVYCMEAYL